MCSICDVIQHRDCVRGCWRCRLPFIPCKMAPGRFSLSHIQEFADVGRAWSLSRGVEIISRSLPWALDPSPKPLPSSSWVKDRLVNCTYCRTSSGGGEEGGYNRLAGLILNQYNTTPHKGALVKHRLHLDQTVYIFCGVQNLGCGTWSPAVGVHHRVPVLAASPPPTPKSSLLKSPLESYHRGACGWGNMYSRETYKWLLPSCRTWHSSGFQQC